jgi:hypothetical protein
LDGLLKTALGTLGKPFEKEKLAFCFQRGIGASRINTTLAMKITSVKKARPFCTVVEWLARTLADA